MNRVLSLKPWRPRGVRSSLAALAALALCLGPLAVGPAAADSPPEEAAVVLQQSVETPASPGEPEKPDEDPKPGADASPLPGQSDQPAPASREKLVLDHGHIDAFTPVPTEDGGLRLMIKEDVTGLNVLREPESLILHVKPGALLTVPAGFVPGLSGEAYHLPLTQNPALIWPGWETQLIVDEFPGANTGIVVSEIDGPGEVFLWSQNVLGGVTSLLQGGGFELPATISQPYPAHTHAAWAFTEAGSYVFTVRAEVTATDGRSASTQTARYTFVVGELEDHIVRTSTELGVDKTTTESGEAVTFTAEVQPLAEGAVQFREQTSGAILGHTPVDDGVAAFRTGALQPGEHRIVAEFVPSWSNESAPSRSEPVAVAVSGDERQKPEHDDLEAVGEKLLNETAAGLGVVVTSPDNVAEPGGAVTARLSGEQWRGDWVSVWVHSEPSWLGWVQSDLEGRFSLQLPEQLEPGSHRLVVKDREGGFIGWDAFTLEKQPEPPVEPPVEPPPPPVEPPVEPQECRPPITLEYGHIDAFTVSAGAGMAVLQILEDVTGHRVLREVESVLLRVKESAYASIPGLPGGPAGYVLPLSQNPNLIWPGWDTNRTAASGYSDVSINVTGVSGPGQVYLYTSQGAFGGWRPILTHGGYTLPGTIHEPTPAHTHAQWVFTQPGVYVLTAHAIATNPGTGASLVTASHSYVFQVGDAPLGDVFCGLSAHGDGASAVVNAAVQEAGLEAIAAEQAEQAKQSERTAEGERGPRRIASAANESAAPAPPSAAELPVMVVVGIVGGGALMLVGIAAGTVWMLRRMRDDAGDLAAAAGPATVSTVSSGGGGGDGPAGT